MKTVSGTIVSSKPVSLSKAANILSIFVNSENEASQSVSTYLRRTSAAFNELVYLKKHHKHKKYQTIEEGSSKSDINPRNSVEENGGGVNTKFDNDPVYEKDNGNVEGKVEKKEKKKKKKKKDKGSLGKSEEDNEIVKENSEEEKKKKKKRKNEEVEEDEISNSKKKKRRRTEAAADNE